MRRSKTRAACRIPLHSTAASVPLHNQRGTKIVRLNAQPHVASVQPLIRIHSPSQLVDVVIEKDKHRCVVLRFLLSQSAYAVVVQVSD